MVAGCTHSQEQPAQNVTAATEGADGDSHDHVDMGVPGEKKTPPPGYRERWANNVSWGASLDTSNSRHAYLGLDSDPRSDLGTIPRPKQVSEAASQS